MVFVLLMLGYCVVFAQLVRLQVMEHDMWAWESRRSASRLTSLPFERGWILDRKGVPLARTEAIDDLTFSQRAWRRGSVAGLVSGASWTLGALWRPPSSLRVDPAADLAALGTLSVGEIASLEPYHRRDDLVGFYVARLFGRPISSALSARLKAETLVEDVSLLELPGFGEALAVAQERAIRESDAWDRMAALVGPDLHDEVDAAARKSVGFVAHAAKLEEGWSTAAIDDREGWRRVQELQAEFEHEARDVVNQVPYDAVTLMALRGDELSGFALRSHSRRVYPEAMAETAALIVGTVGGPQRQDTEPAEENRKRLAWLASLDDLLPEELDEYERLRVQVREYDYRDTEQRGASGVERSLEPILRGRRGWEASWLDVDGQRRTESQPPVRGRDVHLTLDAGLQQAAQAVLDEVWAQAPEVPDAPPGAPDQWSGAIVLLDPRNGDVLVAASSPRPTRWQLGPGYAEADGDPDRPLSHRALLAGFSGNPPPPGSTFKPVSALAGLGSGSIDPSTTFFCDGGLGEEPWRMGCLGNHGEIDLAGALAVSCNVYFYRVGLEVGAERMADMARAFGFGASSRLLQGNTRLTDAGLQVAWGLSELDPVFDPRPWTQQHAMRFAIGQSPLDDVTPVQVAAMMGALGTGFVLPPRLVDSVEGEQLADALPTPVPATAAHLAIVRAAMAGVVDPMARGTASHLTLLFPEVAVHVAAKTGTAEVGGKPDQAWFAGYLPRQDPKLAFAVLVEDCGLHGSEAALPVFMRLLEQPAMDQFVHDEVLAGLSAREGTR
jgi:cell division protein FtsI/penicillin-binding protein 2